MGRKGLGTREEAWGDDDVGGKGLGANNVGARRLVRRRGVGGGKRQVRLRARGNDGEGMTKRTGEGRAKTRGDDEGKEEDRGTRGEPALTRNERESLPSLPTPPAQFVVPGGTGTR